MTEITGIEVLESELYGLQYVRRWATCEVVNQNSAIGQLSDRQRRPSVIVRRAACDPATRPGLFDPAKPLDEPRGTHDTTDAIPAEGADACLKQAEVVSVNTQSEEGVRGAFPNSGAPRPPRGLRLVMLAAPGAGFDVNNAVKARDVGFEI